MATKILVPLDGSALSEAALPVAKRLAAGLQADLILLTVGALPEPTAQAREEREALGEMLAEVACRCDGLTVHQRLDVGGDPVTGILRAMREEAVDMVVMSTHGRSGLARLAQGSTADSVLRAGLVPVALIRPRPESAARPSVCPTA